MNRGLLLSPFSAESERMAYALVKSLRRYNADLPVLVLAQDYVCGLRWRGLAQVRSIRAAEPHRSPAQWLNKIHALRASPFTETIWLDCDIVFLDDPSDWFERLGSDDFTFFNYLCRAEDTPDTTSLNVVNPHRMKERYGVECLRCIDGAGHYFLRKSERGTAILNRITALMTEALELREQSLYWQLAGAGNVDASDEVAASIVGVEMNIQFPPPSVAAEKPIFAFLPPHQHHEDMALNEGWASYHDDWSQRRLFPRAVHFVAQGKRNGAYQDFVSRCAADASPLLTVVPPWRRQRFLFDLGYHYGEGMNDLRRQYGVDASWRVFAFEPNAVCHLALDAEPSVIPMPFAVHNTCGAAEFAREAVCPGGKEDGEGSHLAEIEFCVDRRGGGTEASWKVDFAQFLQSLIPAGRQTAFVIVKMDVEGAEYALLRKMLETAAIDLVDVLHVEFHHRLMPHESPQSTEALAGELRGRVRLIEHP